MKPVIPHDPLDDLIAAALHGDLSPEERARFDSRLQTDPAAAAAYQEAQAMHDLLEKANRSAQPNADFEQRMVSGVRRKLAQPTHRETAWESLLVLWRMILPKPRRLGWIQMAVALATLVLLGSIILVSGSASLNSARRPLGVFATITSQLAVASAPAGPAEFNIEATKLAELDSLKEEKDLKKVIRGQGFDYTETAQKGLSLSGYVDKSYTEQFGGRAVGGNNPNADSDGSQPRSFSAQYGFSSATPQNDTKRKLAELASTSDSVEHAVEGIVDQNGAPPEGPSATPSPKPIEKLADAAQGIEAAVPDAAPAQTVVDSTAATASAPPADSSTPPSVVLQVPVGAEFANNRVDTDARKDAFQSKAEVEKAPPSASAPAATTNSAPEDSRKLIRNAQLDLEVKSFQSAFDQITAMTRGAGGYVDTSSSQRGGNGKLQGTVVVKILPPNLDAFLLKLRDLGDVQNQSVSTDDVTKDYFDTQARLVNSQKMELQLQDLLKRENGNVSDLLAVERELGRVRGDIEGMQGQLKLYDFQVQYATVTMNLAEKDLNQAAAYLLQELDDFSLYATDVEGTFEKARVAAADFKAQVLVADLKHNSGSDVSAMMVVSVPPEQIEAFLAQIRSLGRVANFTRDTKRVPKDGGDPNQPADQALTQSDKVTVNIAIRSDDESRKQVALTVIAKAVDEALDQAKAAALSQPGVEILGSSLNKAPQGASTAQLSVRVPGKEYAAVLDAFRGLGRSASLTIQRRDNSGPGASGDDAPVILSLSLTDEEVPVQTTDLVIVSKNVDDLSQQIKKDAIAAGVEVKASSFEGQPNGTHLARLTLFLPIAKYPDYIATLKKAGRVQSLSVQRSDAAGTDAATEEAPVSISLALTDDDPPVQATQLVIVADDVDAQSQQIKKEAAAAGVEVKDSSFGRDPDGSEHAQMTLHLPMGQYTSYVESLKKAGKVESLSVQREDRPEVPTADDSAPVEITLQLHNEPAIVADNAGPWTTLRQMFGEGFGALFGSVRVIGVLLAFIAPWVFTLVLFAWIARRIYVWRKNR